MNNFPQKHPRVDYSLIGYIILTNSPPIPENHKGLKDMTCLSYILEFHPWKGFLLIIYCHTTCWTKYVIFIFLCKEIKNHILLPLNILKYINRYSK